MKPLHLITAAGLALAALLWWKLDADPEAPVPQPTDKATALALQSGVLTPPWQDGPASSAGPATAAEPAAIAVLPVTAIRTLPAPAALRLLKSCYFSERCGFPETDNLSAHFAAAQAITERLDALSARSGSASELGALARDFLAFPDGHVQAAALALAARLGPDAATVNAAVQALGDSYDELFFRKALPVLQQWQSHGLSSGYDDMLVATLKTGGLHAAQVVAENLQPFINESNVARFEAVLQGLQPGARQTALRQSLSHYLLLRAGG